MFKRQKPTSSVAHSSYNTLATVGVLLMTLALSFPALATNTDNNIQNTVENAESHLEFITDFGADCVSRSAKQILIQNHHASKSVKVKLFRFFGEVRQPGRAVYVLPAGEEPLALGCDKIQGRVQRWEINKAEFE